MIIQEIIYNKKIIKKYKSHDAQTKEYCKHIGYGASGSFDSKTKLGTISSHLRECKKLEKSGYKNLHFCNGGDDDILIVDHDKKVFAFVEYGNLIEIGEEIKLPITPPPNKSMEKIYILYRPVLDYEESQTSYLACETKEQAEKVRAEIISECNKNASQLTFEDPDLSDDEWLDLYDKNNTVRNSVKWPYDLTELKYDLQKHSQWSDSQCKFVDSYIFNENAIAIMELPVI